MVFPGPLSVYYPGATHWEYVQVQEMQKAGVCSFQACMTLAVQAGKATTAVVAAEQMAACLGRSDAQAAAEAILMAQSAQTVRDLEVLYQDAAAPQVAPAQPVDHVLYLCMHCVCKVFPACIVCVGTHCYRPDVQCCHLKHSENAKHLFTALSRPYRT